ncbi:hypothetical protein WBG83_09105 [Paenibacillus sp. y28]
MNHPVCAAGSGFARCSAPGRAYLELVQGLAGIIVAMVLFISYEWEGG